MKKIFIIALFLLAATAYADVIPNGSHWVDRCFKITNLDKFPKTTVKAVVTGPMINGIEEKVVKNNTCIDGGYKFNTVDLVVYSPELGQRTLLKDIEFSGITLTDSDPTISITSEYMFSINEYEGNYYLTKARTIKKYNNGQTDQIQNHKQYLGDESISESDYDICVKPYKKFKKGDSGTLVFQLQGYLQLKPDGKFGKKTVDALKKFQKNNGLKVDGIAGAGTIQALCSK